MQSVVRTSLCLSLLASFDNGSKTFVLCVLRTKGFHLPCKPSPTPIPSLRLVAILLFLFISVHYRLNPAAGGSVLSGFFFGVALRESWACVSEGSCAAALAAVLALRCSGLLGQAFLRSAGILRLLGKLQEFAPRTRLVVALHRFANGANNEMTLTP